MKTSEQINEIAQALAKAQADIKNATRGSENPFHKSKYADLADIRNACQEQLSANGIAVIQAPSTDDQGHVSVTTRLLHTSGQWIETTMTGLPSADNQGRITAQALGSVVTYLRRYTLAAMANVATEDDDGEGASGRGKSDGEKMTVKGHKVSDKQPDDINVDAAAYVVPEEFWDRPNLGVSDPNIKKVNEWLALLRAHVEQAPTTDHVNRMWMDNDDKIKKLSEVRQYWCNEIMSSRLAELEPPVSAA